MDPGPPDAVLSNLAILALGVRASYVCRRPDMSWGSPFWKERGAFCASPAAANHSWDHLSPIGLVKLRPSQGPIPLWADRVTFGDPRAPPP